MRFKYILFSSLSLVVIVAVASFAFLIKKDDQSLNHSVSPSSVQADSLSRADLLAVSMFSSRASVSIDAPKDFEYSTFRVGDVDVLSGEDRKEGRYFVALSTNDIHKDFESMQEWFDDNPRLLPSFPQPLIDVVVESQQIKNVNGFESLSIYSGCNGNQAVLFMHAIRKDRKGSYLIGFRMPPEVMDSEEESLEKLLAQVRALKKYRTASQE